MTMSFWHTVLAVMLGVGLYDVAMMLISPDEGDDDESTV